MKFNRLSLFRCAQLSLAVGAFFMFAFTLGYAAAEHSWLLAVACLGYISICVLNLWRMDYQARWDEAERRRLMKEFEDELKN